MSQKIVITANMKGPAESKVATPTYQWHWRRIVIAAGVVLLLLGAFYGLISSVNAEQNNADDTPSSATEVETLQSNAVQSNHEELDLEPKSEATQSKPESELAQVELNSSTSEDEQVAVVNSSDAVQATVEVGEDEVINAEQMSRASQQEALVTSPPDDLQEPLLETNSEQLATPSQHDEQDGFSQSAHVANVALGASIDTEKVSRAVLTREVQNREPVNVFQADIRLSDFTETLAFFSELKNLQGQRVQHIWYYQGEVVASIDLNVTTPRYRTYSNKNIMAEQVGQWRIDVVDEQGHLLTKKEFRILAD